MTFLDQPKTIRQGKELDQQALATYLSDQLPTLQDNLQGDLQGELQIEQFPSGYSNLTYAVQFGEQALVHHPH